jgi:N6-adenosine-specific RNA methylase IME4
MGSKPRKKRYRVILADPPWQFADRGTRMAPSYAGPARTYAHYSVMGLDGICSMGQWVKSQALDDSALLLWAPGAFVIDGSVARVAKEWGFVPKQLCEWVKTSKSGKPRIGAGHYARLCTEALVICTRGRMAPLVKDHGVPNIIFAERAAHSAKPDESYAFIEKLFPGPYLELFARRRYSKRWDVWGNQAPQ